MTAYYNENDAQKAACLREFIKANLIAAGEVRKGVGAPELGQRFRCANAAGAVTGNASRFINALSVLNIMGALLNGLTKEQNGPSENK